MNTEQAELKLIMLSLSKGAFQTFLRLKQDVGRLVTREVLLNEMGVSEATLRHHITEIRRVLGKDAIRTVHTVGHILDRITLGG